jgi:hypothetical protein
VDTLYDLALTRSMLDAIRRATPGIFKRSHSHHHQRKHYMNMVCATNSP